MAKKKIPDFASLDEAVEFWEAHSFADYAEDTEPMEIEVNLPVKESQLEIRLEAPLAVRVQALAEQRHTTPKQLVETWIKEQLQREQVA